MPLHRVLLPMMTAFLFGCPSENGSESDPIPPPPMDTAMPSDPADAGSRSDGDPPPQMDAVVRADSTPEIDASIQEDAQPSADAADGGASIVDAAQPADAMMAPDGARPSPPDGGASDEWALVWSDEFDGDAIDETKWTHEVNCWGGGNNEDQCYVNERKNSYVRDGSLHLVVLADNPRGAIGGPGNDQTVVGKGHSSARLVTQGNGQWRYGRMEARLKLPCGQGLWPAFWMMPADSEYGGWAASGEIDIMEAVNLDCAAEAHEVHGTLHYGGGWPDNVNTGAHTMTSTSAVTEFHDYAVEWEPGIIRWFVDGVHFATQSNWCSVAAAYPAPFDKPFFFILNVAIGGQWPGPPDATTRLPQRMEVDYVRVFQCENDVGCGTADPEIMPVRPLARCNQERRMADGPEVWLYQDGVNRADWPGGNSWSQNPGKVIIEDVEDEGNTVWSARWTDVDGGGNLYIQSANEQKWDLRNFRETGRLEFRIKAVSLGNTDALWLKVDSGYPALGQVNILDQMRVGEWVTVRVPIQTFVDNPGEQPLDLSGVFTPFVLEPSWGAAGVDLRIDDIRWVRD